MFFAINAKISNAKVNGRCIKVSKDGLLNEADKNYAQIVCRRCGSIFFPEDRVEYIENNPVDLRVMTHQGAGPLENERISWWWFTKDELDFDTIGWQTIDRKKVLMCAECDLGPIGYRSEDNNRFFVAVERVSYKPVDSSEDDDDDDSKKTAVPVGKSTNKAGKPSHGQVKSAPGSKNKTKTK